MEDVSTVKRLDEDYRMGRATVAYLDPNALKR